MRQFNISMFLYHPQYIGTYKESIIIDANQLEMGKKYLIAMKGLFNDSSTSGDPNYIHMTFQTNFPPYNGDCSVNTSTGELHNNYITLFK